LKKGRIAKTTGFELAKLDPEEQKRFEKLLDKRKKPLFAQVERYRKQQAAEQLLDAIERTPEIERVIRCPHCGGEIKL